MIRQDITFHGIQNLRVAISEYCVTISTPEGLELNFFPAGGDTYDLAQDLSALILEAFAKNAKAAQEK